MAVVVAAGGGSGSEGVKMVESAHSAIQWIGHHPDSGIEEGLQCYDPALVVVLVDLVLMV